jgi:glycosyltransferase involved in cell wall biosynthesis
MMRIGLIVPGFSADPTDWCIPALRHLARSLASQDDVRVIALRYPYRAARYTLDGIETITLGGAVRRRLATADLWRAALGVLRREHQRRPFDVMHAFWATESGLLAAAAGRWLGVPTLVSLAGGELVALPDIHYGDQRLVSERLKVAASLRLATGVSAGSRQLAHMAEARGRARPGNDHQYFHANQRVHVAPLGVDLDLFNPAAPRSTEVGLPQPMPPGPRLLHVGTLIPVKDHALLLRAFAAVRRRGMPATLELVGDGPLRPQLERLAHDLGLGGSVRFRGEVDHAALPAVYQTADACVISSRHEAQCMVALEAAACGVPVVGTRVGVIPELTAEVAPVSNSVALADAIAATLAGHPSAMHAGITTRVRSTFGLQTCADRFRGLYASLGSS